MSSSVISAIPISSRPRGKLTAPTAVRSRLRITRRGQFVVTIAVAIPIACAAFVISINGGGAVATGSTGSHSFHHVTVEAGQSLWQLAVQVAPTADPRSVMSDIADLNQLDSVTLQPGQSLAIPQKYAQ